MPGALSIWEEGLPRFVGWFLSYDKPCLSADWPILLVTETNDVSQAVRHLIRLGFDWLDGFLAGGMLAWHTAGLASHRVETTARPMQCEIR